MSYIINELYDEDLRATAATGCNIKINGHWVLDTQMGSGTHILGHGFTNGIILKNLNAGSLFIAPNRIADLCGDALHHTTGFNKFIFANSGSEATMKALRIARAFTERDKIGVFIGHWHGSQDYNLVDCSLGIPRAVKDIVEILPLDDRAFDVIKKKELACVIIEPVQSSCPVNRQEFLNKLREITLATGTLLIFDEVITGFRLALGGGAEYFKIRPDIACYGKIVGGGFPVGVIAGDGALDIVKMGVRMGGTFSGNPVTANACLEMLTNLINKEPHKEIEENLSILDDLKSDKLQVKRVGTMARLIFTPREVNSVRERDEFEAPYVCQKKMMAKLLRAGIYIGSNKLILPSILHTKEKINLIKECLKSL